MTKQNNFKTILFFTILLNLYAITVIAEESLLSKKVNLHLKDQTIEKALDDIHAQTGVFFAYNAAQVNVDSIISYQCADKTINQVLTDLFSAQSSFKENGKYIIISDGKTGKEQRSFVLKGLVFDRKTQQPIYNTTIYVPGKNKLMRTDLKGAFIFKGEGDQNTITLAIRNVHYHDTIISIPFEADKTLKIGLRQLPEMALMTPITGKSLPANYTDSIRHKKSIEDELAFNVFVSDPKMEIMASLYELQNIESPVQVSLIPGISTNSFFNSVSDNNISLNIIAGYARNVSGVEFGGVANIIKNDVEGAQFAGITNIVGNDVEGGQFAGVSNMTLGKVTGAQGAGFHNHAKYVDGIQAAGFINSCKAINGAQLAGGINFSDSIVNIQAAGFINAAKNVGCQLAGFVNFSDSLAGMQASGFVNLARGEVAHLQATGFVNMAKSVDYQLAGFVNIAGHAKKMQVGLLNYADTVSGISIGLLSFVKKGYRVIDLGSGTDYQFSGAFKTGTYQFYNILGLNVINRDSLFVAPGYGIGTEIHFSKRFGMNIEAVANLLLNFSNFNDVLNGYNYQLKCTPNFYISKSFGLYVGPVFNIYHEFSGEPIEYDPLNNENTVSIENTDARFLSWMSVQGGIRFKF